MSFQEEEMDYAAGDYEMGEVEEDMYFAGRLMGDSESEEEEEDEYDNLDNKITDTSAAEARKGKDIQGIPWERLSISREKYRQTRLEQYKNYENIPQSGEGQKRNAKQQEKVEYIMSSGRTQNMSNRLFFIFSGAVHFTASNNDCGVRDFDMERFQLVKHFSYPWPHTSLSPHGKIIAIVGDNPDGMLVDSQTERLLHTCEGTWISLFHLHGIPMGTPLPLGTKTKLAVYRTRGCCLHLLLYSRKILVLFVPSVLHLTGSLWQWLNQLILFMCMTSRMDTIKSRRLISLVRSLESHSVLIQIAYSLGCGIVPMVASFSTTVAETTHISML